MKKTTKPSVPTPLRALSVSLALIVGLSGCAAQPTVTLASGVGLPDSQLSILRKDPNDGDGIMIYSYLNGVVDMQGRQIVLKSESFKDYLEIKLAPGEYDVMLKTYGYQKVPAFPRVRLETKAGYTYYFRGVPIMDRTAVRAEYREEKTPLDAAGNAIPAAKK